MKILFAGTGSAFTMRDFQTNLVIQRNGKSLLVDCGSDARHALSALGMGAKDIDAVYVTHLHADHIGGLEWLAFSAYFDPSVKEKPQLIANSALLRELWGSSLCGGLKCIQGKRTNLVDFFDVQAVRSNGTFEWEGVRFSIVQSVHVMDGYAIVPSYGLMFEADWKAPPEDAGPRTVFVTGDTQFNPNQIIDFYRRAHLVIQDCETAQFRSGVHAHYDELRTLPADVKAKMLLVHRQDNVIRQADVGTAKRFLERQAKRTSRLGAPWGEIPEGTRQVFAELLASSGVVAERSLSEEWDKRAESDGFPMVCTTDGFGWHGFVPSGFSIDTEEWFAR